MQALHQTFRTVARTLQGLAPTAKLLVGALMVILVMTLFLVAQYASRVAYEPLGLHVNLSGEARTKALGHLRARNIPFRERGSEILVPPQEKYAILAQLTDGQVISPDQIDFDALIKQDSPFLSRSQNDRRWLVATRNVLGRTISQFSGVVRAEIFIDEPKHQIGFGRANLPASASVNVWMRGALPLDQQRVDAIAALVAGAHAHLKIDNVEVVDMTAGRRHRARPPEAMAVGRTLELQLEKERTVREKLSEHLSYIPGVNVAVHVTVDTREIIEQRRQYDEPRVGPTRERTHRIDSVTQTGGAAEPGIRPNVGATVDGGSRRGSTLTDERSEAAMMPVFGGSDSRITDSRGHALQINAAIGVPKSYFVRLWQDRENDQNAQPDQAALDALVAVERARIQGQIEPLVDTRAVDGAMPGTVVVSMIPDFAMPIIVGPGVQGAPVTGDSAAGSIAGAMSEGTVGYIALGVLTLISLAMMFTMVRRASAREEMPTAAELVGVPPALQQEDSDLVGEAAETTPSLVGLEIDEDELRRQQMLDQINDMARNNPAEAAQLIRRWARAEG
jgi:flagellar biosynthesis/type III secretory pathway M-ring protein FliF/YscJ